MTSHIDPILERAERTYHPELYGAHTPCALIDFFEGRLDEMRLGDNYFHLCERYRIHYGDMRSGRAWNRIDTGYLAVGISPLVFILLYNSRSITGPAVMMNNIVKIEQIRGCVTLYRHPNFHTHEEDPPEYESKPSQQRALRKVNIQRKPNGERNT